MSVTLTHDFVRSLLPTRPEGGHKGTFGHVCIFAGSTPFSGAAKMTAMGAGRSGVGLVSLGVPQGIWLSVDSGLLEPMVTALPSHDGSHLDEQSLAAAALLLAGKHAMVIGPGLGQSPGSSVFVTHMLSNDHPPAVVDADGLNVLAANGHVDLLAHTICTPHPGELSRLMKTSTESIQSDRPGHAERFALDTGAVVVLKGKDTVVATPDGTSYVASVGNAGMATGGSGDVLAGIIGGLLAQGASLRDSAILGVCVHGLAGDLAKSYWSERGMIAGDIVDALGEAWRHIEEVESP